MVPNILKILTIILFGFVSQISGQEIWHESFDVPGKGIWGNGEGIISSDFEGIVNWTIEYAAVEVTNEDDYAKTVSTSGGRFEVRDVEGEITWRSQWIDISGYQQIKIELNAGETGSADNQETKYLKAFYKLDGADETPFEINGENAGNWGTVAAEQNNLKGNTLQIIVKMANNYSADKVILDEVSVSAVVNYEEAKTGDILLNEILFNPFPGGSDFVEVYNNSDKIISIKNLFLASRDNDFELTQVYRLSEIDFPLQPGEYLALTKDTNGIYPFYFIECDKCFRQMDKFPSFNNDEDVVVLLNENMEVLDEFHYNEKMHSPFFYDEEGVSLERISWDDDTNSAENWFSASTEAGYATPGYKNSQAGNALVSAPHVTFEPEAFSPNLDGYNDEYMIHYEFGKPGFIANAWIFDAAGHLILQLAKNNILGTSGTFTWNGEDETGQRQPLGVYVVAVEIFNTKGETFRYKDGVVLTDILE